LACRPYPLAGLTKNFSGSRKNSLFALQATLDSNAMPFETFDRALRAFLDRRSPDIHYRIVLHPRECSRTLERLTEQFVERSISFEILPPLDNTLEDAFPDLDCGEVSTFYSTSAFVCHALYGVPFDTMLSELAALPFDKPAKKELILFLNEIVAGELV
jgi:hypothetical protein